jgi:hypothetical protein
MMIGLLLLVLATPTQIDKAGRQAHDAVRDFQRIVLVAAQDPRHSWPTLDQQTEITAKIAIARECIDDTLKLGVTLAPGVPFSPQARSMLRSEIQAVAALNGLVGPNAPKAARTAINRVQDAFAKLLALFPVGNVFDDHPPVKGTS